MGIFDKFKIFQLKLDDETKKEASQEPPRVGGQAEVDNLLKEAKKDLLGGNLFSDSISQEDMDRILSPSVEAEPESRESELIKIPGGSGISQEDIDRIFGEQTLEESLDIPKEEIEKLVYGGAGAEVTESLGAEKENGTSFSEKLSQKMQSVYEKAKEISTRDIKTFFTKERESQIVETGGKITYDTLGTIVGSKAITDWFLYGLHKAGVKSSIKGDVHKYFAENDMERALVGIANHVVALSKHKEEIKNANEEERKIAMDGFKPELKNAIRNYRAKVDNLNVSEEKKKALRLELSSIIRDHKKQGLIIAKGESEKFDQVMRHYTGNKVSGLKLGKDALNSALSLSGFYALRGASYLGFSALEKGKESWDKKSREIYNAKREEIKITKNTEDMPDWQSNYRELSSEKMKAVLKGMTIDSAKETYNELVHGRKEGKSVEAKERKENFKVEKSANIEMLKKLLEKEGVGLFGRTWRVNWERVKNLNPETIKENLMRLQALGKIARVTGVSLVWYQAYETDGSMFKGAYDKLLDNIEKGGIMKTAGDNMYGNVARLSDAYDKTAEKLHEAKIFDLKTWQDGYHHIAEKFHHTDAKTGQTDLEKEFNEREGKRFRIEKDGTSTPVANETEVSGIGTGEEKSPVEGSGARQVPVSGGENIEVQKVAVEKITQPKHFQIAEKVTLKRGDSIWTVGEKHLEGNPDFHKLKGFLRIYNIDRVKDTIVAHPEKYGLKPGFNPEKMSAKQIQEIKWQQAFDDTFRKNGITTHLPKGHRGGGDHHHAVHREVPKSSSEAGKGDYTKEGGIKPLEAPVVPGTNVEVPPVDETKIYVDPHLVIDKGSQFADEYQTWGKASADDFLHGRFGEPIVAPEHYKADGKLEWEKPIVHKQADAAEISHRNLLRERLQNAHDLIGDPKKGESVADFMARYNLKNADVNSSIYNHLKNEAIISGGSAVKAESWAIIDKMPSELKKSIFENFAANKGVAFGYVKMFFGDRGGVKDGIKAFFNYQGEVNPEDIKIKSDGSILYEDAFGKQGYDLQISREKIGVDGPGWNNLPKNRMNLDNISAAKRFILSGKTTEDNINDYFKMDKGEKIEKTFAEKVVETPRATELSEKQKPEIRIKPKGKIIDISTESPVPEKSPSTKVIDLSVEAEKGSAEIIKSIDAQIPKADLKHFNELVFKYKDMSDNDLEEAVKAAPEGKERSLVAKAIAKVMEMRNLEDEKNF